MVARRYEVERLNRQLLKQDHGRSLKGSAVKRKWRAGDAGEGEGHLVAGGMDAKTLCTSRKVQTQRGFWRIRDSDNLPYNWSNVMS